MDLPFECASQPPSIWYAAAETPQIKSFPKSSFLNNILSRNLVENISKVYPVQFFFRVRTGGWHGKRKLNCSMFFKNFVYYFLRNIWIVNPDNFPALYPVSYFFSLRYF